MELTRCLHGHSKNQQNMAKCPFHAISHTALNAIFAWFAPAALKGFRHPRGRGYPFFYRDSEGWGLPKFYGDSEGGGVCIFYGHFSRKGPPPPLTRNSEQSLKEVHFCYSFGINVKSFQKNIFVENKLQKILLFFYFKFNVKKISKNLCDMDEQCLAHIIWRTYSMQKESLFVLQQLVTHQVAVITAYLLLSHLTWKSQYTSNLHLKALFSMNQMAKDELI